MSGTLNEVKGVITLKEEPETDTCCKFIAWVLVLVLFGVVLLYMTRYFSSEECVNLRSHNLERDDSQHVADDPHTCQGCGHPISDMLNLSHQNCAGPVLV
jgi:hypothetical protein